MNDWNQAPPADPARSGDESPGGGPVFEPAGTPAPPATYPAESERGLTVWLILLAFGGTALVLAGRGDAAALLAIAGQFVAARAADRNPRWTLFHIAFQFITPLAGALAFLGIARLATTTELTAPVRGVAAGWSIGAAILSGLLLSRRFTNGLAQSFFHVAEPNRVLRLAARLVMLGFLLPVPIRLLSAELMDALARAGGIADPVGLVCSLAGQVVLAFAAVGLLLDRGPRESFARLGLGPVRIAWLGVALVALAVCVGLNSGLEAVQQRWFPALWAADREMTRVLVGDLSPRAILLLGLSAGIGEEITVRGALQPRLGLVVSSLLFAALHVQYTWFGMATVALLGLLLGIVRQRTNTTTAILVHVGYDVIAGMSS